MRATAAIGQDHPRLRPIVRDALATLRKAWTAHTLKRAIADVAAMREQDYRAFGLDKAEVLTALERLRDEMEDAPLTAGRSGADGNGVPLAIVVARRKPEVRVGA